MNTFQDHLYTGPLNCISEGWIHAGCVCEGCIILIPDGTWGRGMRKPGNPSGEYLFIRKMVYNTLITTLFLLFLLATIALLIFLLMRRPSCCRWCKNHFNQGQEDGNTEANEEAQEGFIYLSETHGVVTKKRMWDNPPPYESPPDYHTLNPEIIMDANTLLLNASNTNLARIISNTVNPGLHRNSSSPIGPRGSPVSRTPLMDSSEDSSFSLKERENMKISLQCPPNRPSQLKRTISTPS